MIKQFIKHYFPELPSTNLWMKEHIHEITPEKILFVSAGNQTAGKGRGGRTWISPPDTNLMATFGLTYTKSPTLLPLLTAITISEVLETLGFAPKLKWPNDLILSDKKLCGILVEASGQKAIVGFGLNVNMTNEALAKIPKPATSLLVEGGAPFELTELSDLIIERFLHNLDLNQPSIVKMTRDRLIHKEGDIIHFHDTGRSVTGAFTTLDSNGFLILTLPSGKQQTFASGEISL